MGLEYSGHHLSVPCDKSGVEAPNQYIRRLFWHATKQTGRAAGPIVSHDPISVGQELQKFKPRRADI